MSAFHPKQTSEKSPVLQPTDYVIASMALSQLNPRLAPAGGIPAGDRPHDREHCEHSRGVVGDNVPFVSALFAP